MAREEEVARLKIEKPFKKIPLKRGRKITYGALLAFLAVLLIFLYLRGYLTPARAVPAGRVSQIYPSQTFTQLNASGFVVAQRKASVASKITGRLVSLSVEEGSRVKEGQVIARLENEDALAAQDQAQANLRLAQANLDEARAELENARVNYRRSRELVAKNYISRADYDTAEARYQKAQAALAAVEAAVNARAADLKGAQVALDYSFIRSPFDGVVLTKNADIGDIITPLGAAANAKAAVVTIADLNSLDVEADVSETHLGLVRIGQPCEIQLDALPGSHFRGKVKAIVPTVDRSKATITVKVGFLEKDPRILPEMRAKVSFLSRPVRKDEQKLRTVVNRSAVVSRNGRSLVFLIHSDRVVEAPIRTGQELGEMVEVLEGVKPGDRVVLNPPRNLQGGARIKIEEK